MKIKIKIAVIAVILVMVGFGIACSLHLKRVFVCEDGDVYVILLKEKVTENEYIHPTRLLTIDPNLMSVEIAVEFPERGWISSRCKKNEINKDLGYFVCEIKPNHAEIRIPFSYNGYRWTWK